ncbi:unnamed protein product [Rhizoctonia solani]|uniref:Uncharacterized protein n=1 Tax=Rhizoctonia solani TaxID=456999 RepID=A0A8H3A2G4_9AGAM|nr:unnamed protein product [Rhizoctonia solani]
MALWVRLFNVLYVPNRLPAPCSADRGVIGLPITKWTPTPSATRLVYTDTANSLCYQPSPPCPPKLSSSPYPPSLLYSNIVVPEYQFFNLGLALKTTLEEIGNATGSRSQTQGTVDPATLAGTDYPQGRYIGAPCLANLPITSVQPFGLYDTARLLKTPYHELGMGLDGS